MSVCTSEVMTNHHKETHTSLLASVSDTLHTWRQRYQRRAELARLSDHDFHDVGASWSDFAYEASKPFWRK